MINKKEFSVLVMQGENSDLPDSFQGLRDSGYSIQTISYTDSNLKKTLSDEKIGLFIAIIESPQDLDAVKTAFQINREDNIPIIFIISNEMESCAQEISDLNHHGILPLKHSHFILKEMVLSVINQKKSHIFCLLDSTEDAFFLLHPQKGFVDCNKKTLSFFEVKNKKDFLTLDPIILSPEFQYDGNPSVVVGKEIIQRALEDGSVLFQWTHKLLNGKVLPASILLSRVKIGSENHLLGIIHDMSHSKQAENELVKQEEEYQSTMNNLSLGVVVHAADSSVLLSNPAAEEIMGLSKDQLSGRQVIDPEWCFVHESGYHLKPEEYPVSIVMATKKALENRTMGIIRSDRNYITWVLVNAIPIFDEGGFLSKIIVNLYDITRMRSMEEKLNHSRKMDAIGQLAGGVAHDFNNMLAGIMSSAELLKDRVPAGSTESSYIDMILHSSQRAADLNSKLLSFARKGKSVSSSINIHAIIDETVSILGRSIDKRTRITTRKKASYHTVTGDDSQLQNAFLNLCINASNAMPGGGEIIISTENIDLEEAFCKTSPFELVPGSYLFIEIQDTGIGIPRKNLQKIFEPFFTTKEIGQGTGLGLASVYGAMEQHHGAISVYSEEGEGSSFHLYLPLGDNSVPLIKREERMIPGSGILLLVDDEEVIRISAKKMLEDMNYTVLIAQDGQEAVDLFREKYSEIDLVILDMVMPKMNGKEVFGYMREIDPEARIIISSGFSKSGDLKMMTQQGLCGFIRKPYRKIELNKIIFNVLSR